MTSIVLEVIAPMLSSVELRYWGCNIIPHDLKLRGKYRTDCINEYPDNWKQAGARLSQWIREVSSLYQHRVCIRVIDAFSPIGLWKQIRYGLYRFPAFVIDRKSTYIGWGAEKLESLIDERIRQLV